MNKLDDETQGLVWDTLDALVADPGDRRLRTRTFHLEGLEGAARTTPTTGSLWIIWRLEEDHILVWRVVTE